MSDGRNLIYAVASTADQSTKTPPVALGPDEAMYVARSNDPAAVVSSQKLLLSGSVKNSDFSTATPTELAVITRVHIYAIACMHTDHGVIPKIRSYMYVCIYIDSNKFVYIYIYIYIYLS